MYKPGQKVKHKANAWEGVVVSRAPKWGKNWFGVLWTLPSGRREQRVEHYSAIK